MDSKSTKCNPLSIRLFGDFVFENNLNQPLSFKSRKTEAVLLTLALNREVGVSRDMLCGLLWPDLTQDRARAGLRQALSRIRNLAAEAIIQPKQGWLCLSPQAVKCDPWALIDALGDPEQSDILLPQVSLLNHYPITTDLFSDWVETQKRFILSDLKKSVSSVIGNASLPALKRTRACELALHLNQTDEPLITQILEFCKTGQNEALYQSTRLLYCRKLEADLGLKPSLSFIQNFPEIFPIHARSAQRRENNAPVLAVIEKFQVRGKNPDHAYLAEALPDDIIAHLSRQNWFDVQVKNLSWPHKPANVKEADSRHHEHSYWLHGTIHVHDDMIEVSVRLTHGPSDRIIWSEVFEEKFKNLMSIRRRIVDVIAEHLTTKMVDSMSESVSASVDTEDMPVNVWVATMQARHLFWRTSYENNEKAMGLLDPILKMDNPPVSAFVISAFTRLLKVWSIWAQDLDGEMKAAIKISEKAVRLHPNDPWTHFALATCYGATRQAEKAEQTVNRALSLHDSFAAALGLRGHLRVFAGDLEAGTKDLKNSLKLNAIDPHYGIWQNSVAIAAYLRNDYVAALEWVNKALSTNSYWMQNYVVLTCIYHELGDFENAARHYSKLKKIAPKLSRTNWLFSHPFTHSPSEEKFMKALEPYGF